MNINAHWIYKQQKNAWDKNAWKNEKTVIWTQENSRKKPFCCNICGNEFSFKKKIFLNIVYSRTLYFGPKWSSLGPCSDQTNDFINKGY